ncbi:MAG: hypothetical protein K6G52_00260 [Treponemataceae bacterium]|nr:hypothetical protein [Treponemataceae bacterium]
MSICPSNDIHSVFVDGELPEEFKEEYLSHVASCDKCKNVLETMKFLRHSLIQDKDSIILSKAHIDKGYEKLEDLLDFKKVTAHLDFSKFVPLINRLVPAVAAALLIAFILPVGIKKAFAPQYSADYISQILSNQSPFSAQTISSVIEQENSTSLIKSAQYLTSMNLENIIEYKSESQNIYAPTENIISPNSTEFINVYNSDQNLYNVTYSPFIGF